MTEFYCEVCDRDASDTVVLARWYDCDVCTECLQQKEEMDEAEAAESERCECLDCLRYAVQHQA